MDFMQAVQTVLNNYANFKDRSRRSEYWWWVLAYIIAIIAVSIVGGVIGASMLLSNLLALALLVPNIAVGVRRFHDIGKSGWWLLISLIPVIGWIAVIYFAAQPSDGPNQYGEGPLAPAAKTT
jgi:uncharacterized membrane protein YhaH (DUF805 family)